MVDLHDIIGRLREQLEQVHILDVVPVIARWLRKINCHCGPPAVRLAIWGIMLSYKPYPEFDMRPPGRFATTKQTQTKSK